MGVSADWESGEKKKMRERERGGPRGPKMILSFMDWCGIQTWNFQDRRSLGESNENTATKKNTTMGTMTVNQRFELPITLQ